MNIGDKILKLASDKGVSMADLADMLSIGEHLLYDWKIGLRDPSIWDVIKIADYFGVTTDYILRDGQEI